MVDRFLRYLAVRSGKAARDLRREAGHCRSGSKRTRLIARAQMFQALSVTARREGQDAPAIPGEPSVKSPFPRR